MLSRLASRSSIASLSIGVLIVAGLAVDAMRTETPPPSPEDAEKAARYAKYPGLCTETEDAARAAAVDRFVARADELAEADDPASAQAAALLALPMPCESGGHMYPAIWRPIATTAIAFLHRGEHAIAARLVTIGGTYGAGSAALESVRGMLMEVPCSSLHNETRQRFVGQFLARGIAPREYAGRHALLVAHLEEIPCDCTRGLELPELGPYLERAVLGAIADDNRNAAAALLSRAAFFGVDTNGLRSAQRMLTLD